MINNQSKVRKLTPGRLKNAEYQRIIYAVTPEMGTTFEEIKQPEFWAHVASQFKPHDRIEVTSEDGEWFAELIVVATSKLWAKVTVLRFIELNAVAADRVTIDKPDEFSDFEFVWKGNTLKMCVVRKSDNEVIHDGEPNKEAAMAWTRDHIKANAALSKEE